MSVNEFIGCGDSGCEFERRAVGTNGGCRCFKDIRPVELRLELKRKFSVMRARHKRLLVAVERAGIDVSLDSMRVVQLRNYLRLLKLAVDRMPKKSPGYFFEHRYSRVMADTADDSPAGQLHQMIEEWREHTSNGLDLLASAVLDEIRAKLDQLDELKP